MALPVRKGYNGAPANAVLTNNPGSNVSTDTTFIVDTTTNWGVVPFFCVVEAGTSREEKVKVTAKSGTTLTVVRASDNTTASAHSAGASIYPVFTASEADEANQIASVMTTKGDLISNDGSTINRVGVGANSLVLQADSALTNGIKWGQVANAGIADDAVTSSKILNGTIVLADLAASLQAFLTPVGTINAYAGVTAPAGWLLCDGTSTTGYTLLASYVGATTPDLRGHTLVGKSASAPFDGALLSKFGSTTSTAPHTHDLGSHTHTFSGTSNPMNQNSTLAHTVVDPGHSHTLNGREVNAWEATDLLIGVIESAFSGATYTEATTSSGTGISVNPHDVSHTHTYGGTTTGPTGGSGASSAGATHGNVQPSALVNYIIKHD